ncbi:MAG: alpha/beta hydrolase-fold protein [Hyphomicrobiaceae bacterium]
MCRLLGYVLVLLVACASARAESTLTRESLPSATLGRAFPFMVYLPDGYQRGDLSYPVLYLLHGAGGDEMAWAKEGGIKATADRMIRNGEIPPTVIVMPGCRGCWWVDGAVDKAETAFWKDLVPAVQQRYRTIGGRDGCLIAGLSAGGYGAVRFAMRYPDRVAAIAALSPAVYADTPPAISSARVQPPFRRPDGSFDEAAWKARNYPSLIGGYFRQKQRVAFFLVSGDNDRFGIAFETMALFKDLWGRQPELAELRIVDGDHTWTIWSKSIENAMRYLYRHAARPMPTLIAGARGPAAAAGVAQAPAAQIAQRGSGTPSVESFFP